MLDAFRVGIFERMDPRGHIQQLYSLEFVEESVLVDTWIGEFRPQTKGPAVRTKTGILINADGSLSRRLPVKKLTHTHKCGGQRVGGKRLLVLITFTNHVFGDNALGLQRAIQRLQIADKVVATGDFAYHDYRRLLSDLEAHGGEYEVIQIAVGAHEPALLLRNYIVFDVEQAWSLFMSFNTYEMVLRDALAVFTMSYQHSLKLQDSIAGIDTSKFFHIPLYTRTAAHDFDASRNRDFPAELYKAPSNYIHSYSHLGLSADSEDQVKDRFTVTDTPLSAPEEIDVLLFGVCSDKRREFIATFTRHHDAYLSQGLGPPLKTVFRCITAWTDALIDEERDHYVSRARVAVNVHTWDTSSLEIHRVTYLLAMGKCIVSERSTFDPKLDAQYEGLVLFGDDYDDVAKLVISLLSQRDATALATCEERSRAAYAAADRDTEAIEYALGDAVNRLNRNK